MTKTAAIRVAIVHTSDFESFPRGGGITVIRGILQETPHDFEVTLYGVTPHKHEHLAHIGRRVIGGREFVFIPLFYRNPARAVRRRPVVPLRVVSFMKYVQQLPRWCMGQYDVLYLHAPEAWPLTRCGVPTVFQWHGWGEGAAEYSRYAWVRSRIFMLLYRRIIDNIVSRATKTLFIDNVTYDRYRQRYPSRQNRFGLCRPTIDRTTFRPLGDNGRALSRRHLNIPPDVQVGLAVGRLSKVKGLDHLLEAIPEVLTKYPQFHLLVVGEGEEGKALQAQAARLGIAEHVSFLGQIASERMPEIYGAADVLLLPSHIESFGMVVLEALACGIPVVTRPVGVAAEIVRDGENGTFITALTSAAVAQAVDQGLTLARVPDVAKACAATAQKFSSSAQLVFAALRSASQAPGL